MGNDFVAPYHSKAPLFKPTSEPKHDSGRELTYSPAGIRDRWPQKWINSVLPTNVLRPSAHIHVDPHEFDPVTKKYYWQYRIGAYRHKDEHLERLAQWYRSRNPGRIALTSPPPRKIIPPPPPPSLSDDSEEEPKSSKKDEEPETKIEIVGQRWVDVPLYAVLAARLRPYRPLFGSRFVHVTIPILKFTVPSGTREAKILQAYYDAANVRALVHFLCQDAELRLAYGLGYFEAPMNYVRVEIEERPHNGLLERRPDGSYSYPSMRGIYQGVLYA